MLLKNNNQIYIQFSVMLLHIQNEDSTFKTVPFVNAFNHLFDEPKIIMLDDLAKTDLDCTVSLITQELYDWIDPESKNPSLYVLWHNIYFIRSEFRQDWEDSMLESNNKNGTIIYKKELNQEANESSFLNPKIKFNSSLLSIEKCLIKMNSIECWESIIEETFNGESKNLDLTLDNLEDNSNFKILYRKLIQSYTSVLSIVN